MTNMNTEIITENKIHTDVFKTVATVFLPCDDAQEAVEFAVTSFDDDTTWCEINIMDTYCGKKESKFRYRLRRAWKAFRGEPVYYSGVCVENVDNVKKWLNDCIDIINKYKVAEKKLDI